MKIRNNKINILLSCLVTLAIGCFTACDDTMGGDTVSALGFPTDTLVVDAFPGDIVPVSFKVGYNWKLNSDREWCRVNGEDKSYGGKAGANTVNFVVSDLGNLFEDDEATITLHMNNEKRVIAIITRRSTKDYDVQVNCNGQLLVGGESIVIGDSSRLVLGLEPNFKMDLLKMTAPSWVKLERKDKSLILNVVEDSIKYSINNVEDSLRLVKDSTFYRAFHVEYVGMNPRALQVGGQLKNTLVVSMDTKKMEVNEEPQELPLNFVVTALDDKYEIVSIGYNKKSGCYMLPVEEEWFTLEDDCFGNVDLVAIEENEGNGRAVNILALPQALVDSLDTEEAMLDYLCEDIEGVLELTEDAADFRLVKVQQEGLDKITIDETRWNLRVSVDGAFYSDAIKGDTLNSLEHPLTAEIESADGYELICADYSYGKYTAIAMEDSWLNIEDNQQGGKGNVSVSFDANDGAERTLLLFALPLSFVESMELGSEEYYQNLSAALFPADTLLEEQYVEYVVAKLTQDANPESSIKVLKGGKSLVEVVPETDSEWLKIAKDKGVPENKVFRCSMKLTYFYQIKPLIHKDIWAPIKDTPNWVQIQTDPNLKDSVDVRDKIEIYGKGLNEKGEPINSTKYEMGTDYKMESMLLESTEGDYFLVEIDVEKDDKGFYKINEDFIIYFIRAIDTDGDEEKIDDNVEYVKALVVENLSIKKVDNLSEK